MKGSLAGQTAVLSNSSRMCSHLSRSQKQSEVLCGFHLASFRESQTRGPQTSAWDPGDSVGLVEKPLRPVMMFQSKPTVSLETLPHGAPALGRARQEVVPPRFSESCLESQGPPNCQGTPRSGEALGVQGFLEPVG